LPTTLIAIAINLATLAITLFDACHLIIIAITYVIAVIAIVATIA
jgi:hypothetical protein